MPFGKELSHLIEEQISRAVSGDAAAGSGQGALGGAGIDAGRIALIEANVQRLAEQFTGFLSAQKAGKRNLVDYGLEVIALHGMRLAVTAGRAEFVAKDTPLELPFTYLQLSSADATRQIRYIYLNDAGVVLESATDPTNIGPGYMPLALVDVWSNMSEITQDKIKDIRPMAGSNSAGDTTQTQAQLVGNVTLYSPDTGNDSFVVSAANPAGLKVNISSGRALVGGEIINAEGGALDVSGHRSVNKEFIAISDGVKVTYSLFHQAVQNLIVYVDAVATVVAVDAANGLITFATAPAPGAKLTASYIFSGNYMLVFLVEKTQTQAGQSFGVVGWQTGSNRTSSQPPALNQYQHAIAKVDMSSAITAITDAIIDNSYEVTNLTQDDLQNGGQLGTSSLQTGAVTGDKIAAETITGDKILAGSIDAANIKSGAITADQIAAGAITSSKIAADAIAANMIQAGTISADKFESSTWGDMSQAMRFVKSILGGSQSWRRVLSKTDLSLGAFSQVNVSAEAFPALCLDMVRHWDDGSNWDDGQWDLPVCTSGYWESASIDYGTESNLQAEFWAQLLINDPVVTITVKARYSNDNTTWTNDETLSPGTAFGYLYWTGSLQEFRYFKIRVEFSTTDSSKYALLGNPEVRASNCQIGTEDISDGAITITKLAPELRTRLGL